MSKTAELANAINYLRYQIASLKSAKRGEIANEWRLVVDAINNVKSLQQAGSTPALDARAAAMIGEAFDVKARKATLWRRSQLSTSASIGRLRTASSC